MANGTQRIGSEILQVKTSGFIGGFFNPFSFKVTVTSQDSRLQVKPYKATFLLKNPDDARAFLNQVDKNPSLRTMLIGDEKVVAKAIELLDKSQKQGTGPFDPNASRYKNEKRSFKDQYDDAPQYGNKRVEQEKKRDKQMVGRIASMREYRNDKNVRSAAASMGAKVPKKSDRRLSHAITKDIPGYRKKQEAAMRAR